MTGPEIEHKRWAGKTVGPGGGHPHTIMKVTR